MTTKVSFTFIVCGAGGAGRTVSFKRSVEQPKLAYSVEKLQIGGVVILLPSEHASINRSLTCVQADGQARKAPSAATWCPLVSHSRRPIALPLISRRERKRRDTRH
jgi:hypothetical protein